MLATDTTLWTDDVWVVDSTPVECGRSRQKVRRSDLAGWAEYGYCTSHSRYFWGLRLHLVCTTGGLPIGFAQAGAEADERQTLLGIFASDPALWPAGPDTDRGQELLRQGLRAGLRRGRGRAAASGSTGEDERPDARLFTPLRQTIESINQTFKGQLDLERGRTPAGVRVRVLQRVLALTAAIWHNDKTGQSVKRSLVAYDH